MSLNQKANHNLGFVYILSNPDFPPDLLKIGMTSLTPEDRANDLCTTGLPSEFEIVYRRLTSRFREVEKRTHLLLEKYRYKKEFFKVSEELAIKAVDSALLEAASINGWMPRSPYSIKDKDRIVLTLRQGQVFMLLGYTTGDDIYAQKPRIIDCWEAYADGDTLEIYMTESTECISGFSDHDPNCTEDPIPYLDRKNSVRNGELNGKERLFPGERLCWIPSHEEASSHKGVIFDLRSYGQILGRTWIKPPIEDFLNGVFLLNTITSEGKKSLEKSRGFIEEAGNYSPRRPVLRNDPDSMWSEPYSPGIFGSESASPSYWLTQLEKRKKKGKRKS